MGRLHVCGGPPVKCGCLAEVCDPLPPHGSRPSRVLEGRFVDACGGCGCCLLVQVLNARAPLSLMRVHRAYRSGVQRPPQHPQPPQTRPGGEAWRP